MKRLKFWAALLAVCGILLRPEAAVSGGQAAMRQWFSSVAPALFPFLALMPALTGPEACAAYEAAFAHLMRPLGLPGSAAPAVVIGMIAGSPGGAIALMRIAGQTNMPRRQAVRIALAMCGLSPAYLILGVGQGVCGSARAGITLACLQAAVQLMLLAVLRPFCRDISGSVSAQKAAGGEKPIRAAVETVLGVAGCMVLFSTIGSVAAEFAGEKAGSLLGLVMDLPSGLNGLSLWKEPLSTLLMGAGVGFGGLCIAAQNLDALRGIGVSAGRYLAVRSIAALVMGALAQQLLSCKEREIDLVFHTRTVYAASLLAACAILIPVLIKFSKKLILNRGKA